MLYQYRRGDGNEGNFVRGVVSLSEKDCPFAALRALVPNDYIAGRRVRRHIIRTIEIDGEPEFGISAMCYDGPNGEQAFGAAWLTAELQPIPESDAGDYPNARTLRELLDAPAWRQYRAELKTQIKES